ncbi:MAG: MinD/ParA family protein [Lachnospiraceae bacterium]|nr:MinD/ParA family protein [Lachnospiraceae bacterium]MBQ9936039.1 MinD/ParA family protein [Lachnospiraceae bacterium]
MDQATSLRQRVQESSESSNARVIAVTSGKGGVGKTSLSVNLAMEMAKLGKKVVIFDADFGLANVEVMLGIRPTYNLLDLIHNNKTMPEIITKGPMGIGFISGGSGVSELASLDKNNIKLLISEMVKLDKMYDVVIIDTGAGITDSVMEFVMVSPEVLLVVTPEPTSITDAYSLLKVLRRKNEFNPLYKTINVVSNRVTNDSEGDEIFAKMNTVSSKFLNTKLEYLGSIPQDKNASMAIIEQKPVVSAYPNTPASKAICELASKLINTDQEEYKKKDGIAKVFFDFIKFKKRAK